MAFLGYIPAMLSAKFDYIARSLQAVTAKLGQLPPDNTVEGAAYVGPAENALKAKGQMCRNCVFFRAPYACTIVRAKIDQEGICRFNIIPPEKVVAEAQTADKRRLSAIIGKPQAAAPAAPAVPVVAAASVTPTPAAPAAPEKPDGRK